MYRFTIVLLSFAASLIAARNDTDLETSESVEGTRQRLELEARDRARQSKVIRAGFMFPHNTDELAIKNYGFSTSAGGIVVALERIEREQILPGYNWSITWRNDECDESTASGRMINMVREQDIDVVFGPPCNLPAAITGVIANHYNIAQISWGATSLELADPIRYPTLTRIIGSSLKLGRALSEVLQYFKWIRVAMLYTNDKATRKCLSVAQGAFKHFPLNNIHIVLYQEIDGEMLSDADIEKFLTYFPQLTRIVILCIDFDQDMRRFMLRAQEKGVAGDEYVYIVPDYVRSENQSDIWFNRTEGTSTSGRDAEMRRSMQNIMFFEILLTSNEQLFAYKRRVIEEIKNWPFFYTEPIDDLYGSLYSPFLHDGIYLYALALNKTLENGQSRRDGRAIMQNAQNIHFSGLSGAAQVTTARLT